MGTRKLNLPTDQRMALLRNLVTSFLENGRVETTLTRAKEAQSLAEKMITLGKKNTLATKRSALAYITKEDVVTKLFEQVAPKYAAVNGGYTTIYKLGPRRGDAAEMALLRLFEEPVKEEEKTSKKATKKAEEATLQEAQKGKKEADLTQEEKDAVTNITKELAALKMQLKEQYTAYAASCEKIHQLIDIAMLAAGQLKGEALAKFVNRSVELL